MLNILLPKLLVKLLKIISIATPLFDITLGSLLTFHLFCRGPILTTFLALDFCKGTAFDNMLVDFAVHKFFSTALRALEHPIATLFRVMLVEMPVDDQLATVEWTSHWPKKTFTDVSHSCFIIHTA